MISLSANQFDQQAIHQGDSEIVFEGNIYTKGPSCASALKEIATKYCKLYENQNLLTLLVEDLDDLTIWLQKTVTQSKANPSPKTQTTVEIQPLKPPSISQAVETPSTIPVSKTEKIVRKYRGRTYEKEVPIVEKQSQPQRIYRGRRY